MKRILFTTILALTSIQSLYSQKTIYGTVKDATTGESLPAANVLIEGTLRGVIASREGRYSIRIDHLPATVSVRYIGYESKKIVVTSDSPEEQNIALTPSSIEMEALVVTGEDPGMGVMRRVIEKKKRWHKKVQNFKADMYSRGVLSNDSGIVMISEVLGDMYWTREKGLRMVVKSKRQTKNVDPKANIVIGDDDAVNFYDDDVEIQGSKFVGPTHPDALDYYDFKITERRYMDNKVVCDIAVHSKSKFQPTFVGSVSVIDDDSAMIAVDLKPTESTVFPMPIQEWNVYYKQQFNNFGKEYWLPVDVRVDGKIKIGMTGLQFPPFIYSSISSLSNYDVNMVIPDSLYAKNARRVTVDSVSLKKPNQFDSSDIIIPLSIKEDSAYLMIKRGDSFEKAFKPTGFFASKVKFDDEYNDSVDTKKKKGPFKQFLDDLSPNLAFNRVEGGHLGINYEHEWNKTWTSHIIGGYTTTLKDPFYGGGVNYGWGRRYRNHVKLDYYRGIQPRFEASQYSPWVSSTLPLFGSRDYFDYYQSHRVNLTSDYYIRSADLTLSAGITHDKQTSVSKTTDWDVIGSKYDQRANPAIPEGNLRSVTFKAHYGDEFVPMGIVGVSGVEVAVEHSPSAVSDYHFTTYRGEVNWRIKTLLARRFLPNVLDIRAVAGTYSGKLPIQKFAVLDGSLGTFAMPGTFRSLHSRAYEGEKYAAIFAEHNFRTLPFELIGFDYLVKKNIGIAIYGATGRTWIAKDRLATLGYNPVYQDKLHSEVGGSINGIFSFIRVDFTQRLDKKDFFVGISMARLF